MAEFNKDTNWAAVLQELQHSIANCSWLELKLVWLCEILVITVLLDKFWFTHSYTMQLSGSSYFGILSIYLPVPPNINPNILFYELQLYSIIIIHCYFSYKTVNWFLCQILDHILIILSFTCFHTIISCFFYNIVVLFRC